MNLFSCCAGLSFIPNYLNKVCFVQYIFSQGNIEILALKLSLVEKGEAVCLCI